MNKYILAVCLSLLIFVVAACGGDDDADQPTATTAPAQTAASNQPPGASSGAAAGGTARTGKTLEEIAAELAGGPGAIYVGDLSMLAGPAPNEELGGFDGNVPLESLRRHQFIYESDYYKSLLEKARFTNPTPLVTTGEDITIQYACINRALVWCILSENYFTPNLLARTNGQLNLETTSFPELGIAGPDLLDLLRDGSLSMSDINGAYISGALPALEIQELYGLYPDRETQFASQTALAPDIKELVEGATGGGKLLNFHWAPGNDLFFFSKKALRTPDDFEGLKVRSISASVSDWIIGMGAEAQFVAFAEVYTGLERGILDAGVTGGTAGHGQRWYEVTGYLNGPLTSFQSLNNVVNKKVWDGLPADIQQIMIEEGAKYELELLRVASIQNELGVEKNVRAGMEFVEFSPEVRGQSETATIERIIPNWVKRVGGPDEPIVDVFNKKVGPLVGMRVEPDGSVVRVPIVR